MQEIKIEKRQKAASKSRDYWEGVVDVMSYECHKICRESVARLFN